MGIALIFLKLTNTHKETIKVVLYGGINYGDEVSDRLDVSYLY